MRPLSRRSSRFLGSPSQKRAGFLLLGSPFFCFGGVGWWLIFWFATFFCLFVLLLVFFGLVGSDFLRFAFVCFRLGFDVCLVFVLCWFWFCPAYQAGFYMSSPVGEPQY